MPFQLRISRSANRSSFDSSSGLVAEDPRQNGGDDRLGGARAPVIAFDRDAEPEFRQRTDVNALRTAVFTNMRPGAISINTVQARWVPAT